MIFPTNVMPGISFLLVFLVLSLNNFPLFDNVGETPLEYSQVSRSKNVLLSC